MIFPKFLNWCNAVKTSMAVILITGSSLSASAQNAQDSDLGSWTMYSGQIRFHDKWSLHTEVQYRDYGILDEPEQILLRAGINYHFNPGASVTAGFGRITNYPDDDEFSQTPSVSENRIWQQLLMRNNMGRLYFEHRYRLEQRFIKSDNSERYLDRARYLLRLSLPLNKKEIEKKAWFLGFYDEIFIHFSSPAFDRNRLYGAVGYQFSSHANIQAGYLAQTVNTKTKHYLQAGINYTLDLRMKD